MFVLRSELLGQFVNTFSYKYSRESRNKFQCRQKLKTCSRIAFVKSTLNLEYFGKNDQSPSLSLWKLLTKWQPLPKGHRPTLRQSRTLLRNGISYCSSINLRKRDSEKVGTSQIELLTVC